MKKLFSLIFATCIWASSTYSAPAPRKADFLFELQSSVKGLGVLQDGIMGAGLGAEMEGRKGLNEITVSAPGFVTRKIRFWLEPGRKKLIPIELAKIKFESNSNWKSPFKKFEGARLEKRASACAWYQSKTQDKTSCDRLTYLDDIYYSEDSIFNIKDLKDYQKSQELATFRQLLAGIDQTDSAAGIEDFFTKHPRQTSAFHLASLFSLLQGDCPRVYSLYTEAQQVLEEVGTLRLHMVVCAEAHNDIKLRDHILAEAMNDRAPNLSLVFWLFQTQLPVSMAKAAATALKCYKTNPGDLRCQDALAMTAKVQGKPYRANGASIEEETFRNFMSIEENLPKGQQEALYLAIANQLDEFPQSIENYVLLSWINTVYSKDLARDTYVSRKIQVAEVQAGGTLEKIIESIEKNNLSQILPAIYLRRLRFEPTDPNLWYRLIRSYSKAKQCKEMLSGIVAGTEFLPKFNPGLLQMKGSCEADLQLYKDAVITYTKILDLNPKAWTSPFNLANIYDRLGNKKLAFFYFKRTLELGPPAEVAESVKMKVLQFQPLETTK